MNLNFKFFFKLAKLFRKMLISRNERHMSEKLAKPDLGFLLLKLRLSLLVSFLLTHLRLELLVVLLQLKLQIVFHLICKNQNNPILNLSKTLV